MIGGPRAPPVRPEGAAGKPPCVPRSVRPSLEHGCTARRPRSSAAGHTGIGRRGSPTGALSRRPGAIGGPRPRRNAAAIVHRTARRVTTAGAVRHGMAALRRICRPAVRPVRSTGHRARLERVVLGSDRVRIDRARHRGRFRQNSSRRAENDRTSPGSGRRCDRARPPAGGHGAGAGASTEARTRDAVTPPRTAVPSAPECSRPRKPAPKARAWPGGGTPRRGERRALAILPDASAAVPAGLGAGDVGRAMPRTHVHRSFPGIALVWGRPRCVAHRIRRDRTPLAGRP